ncbi:uro-adherence factor A [Drosophila suzukii]|uniref:Uro-adherence factor A n=1 Tax=Drosophila suzukii TaxID=28584 RepID=A0ABM4TNU2_DROSZ
MTTATSLPRVPEGLRDLMKVYTKEVLREKPADLYGFSANFFNVIVGEKSQKAVRKYEPVQTYETIMKNRIRQQVPLSLVFNIIPEKLTDLIKQFIKAVLREKPENIYIFAQEYFQRLSKEKSGRIEYTKYSTYENSMKDKENVTPGSKVTCECGRILSGKTKDVENRYTDTKLAEADQRTFSSRITYLQSVVIIQRRIRQFLKERKRGRDKDKCNSVEYVTAILLIQRQVRRFLAKKRVEKLKNSRDVRKPNAKFNTGDYMKAVVVIQRHYRIYFRKKQEQNRLKNDPVSLATAAIIIQRAFRRMVTLQRAKRNTSSATDQGEELNDNASETGSYTSVSTALLSTESTELGMATYEERVHQKIIHEDEEVENNNVDAGLEKEFLAEPIKGQEKSMLLRKSEILSGALIETMIRKPSLENLKDSHSESKDFEEDLEIEADKNKASQDLELEIKNIKESLDLESVPQAELIAEKKGEELDLESTTKKASLDVETESQVEPKIEPDSKDLELKKECAIIAQNLSKDIVDQETGEFIEAILPNAMKKRESDGGKENNEKKNIDSPDDVQNNENETPVIESNEIIPPPKSARSESQETPIKSEVTPTVSIEIEHVDDISEDSSPILQDSNAKDSTKGDTKQNESTNLTNVEIDSLTTVLVNHNREKGDTIVETSADAVTATEEKKSTIEDESNLRTREKRSIEGKELVNSNLETTNQTLIKEDISPIVKSELEPINQEEIQISNDQELKVDGSSVTDPKIEDIPKAQTNTKDEIISSSAKKNIVEDTIKAQTNTKDEIISSSAEKNIVQEPLEAVAEASVHEITSDLQIEETITENKGDSEESKGGVKPNSQPEDEPDLTSAADASDLSKSERKSESAEDLELIETDVGLHPETNRLKENLESSTDESNHAVEKVPTEDASDEIQNIQKLSQQETIPIGYNTLETEEAVPSEININKDKSEESNDGFHNFDVFTEGTDLKDKDNLTGSSITKECTDEPAINDINDSMGESILTASTVLEDPLGTSVEHELESAKHVASEDESAQRNKMTAKGSETFQTETEPSDEKDIPTKSESVQAEGSNILQGFTESNSIHSEDSEEKVLSSSPEHRSPSAIGDSPKSEEEDLEFPTKGKGKETSGGDKLPNSVDQRTESTEKALPASPDKNSSSAIEDGLKSGDDVVEYPTKGDGKEVSVADTAIAVMELSPEIKTEAINAQESEGTEAEDNSGNEPAVPPTLAADKDKPTSDVEIGIKDEGPSAVLGKGDSSDHPTKPSETETLPSGQQESSTEMESKSAVVDDKDTAESKTKNDSPVASNPEQKNSSLLVSNQLIGTQNLPTNHIEIEKNTKKLSNPVVKDKDIGTLTSGRLVPTPIAELQLKSFKNPNDDGAWYDIYVEPKATSDKDLEKIPTSNEPKKPDTDQQTASVVDEPIIVSERTPSYYTPKEIIETAAPKAKNSVSFFVSFDSDDGKPKYKIPKRFRDQSKTDSVKEVKNPEVISSESDNDSNEEEIEVIEVSEGDPEYQHTGGSKLQTILEHDNESEQPTDLNNQSQALEPNEIIDIVEDNREKTKAPKRNTEHYEETYKTDILTITRSVRIIERAYRRFKNRGSLKTKGSDLEKQNRAAKIIQKWVRDSLRKKASLASSEIISESQSKKQQVIEKPLQASSSINTLKSTDSTETTNEVQTEDLQDMEKVEEIISNPIHMSSLAEEPKRIKEIKKDEIIELEKLSNVSSNPINLSKSEELQEKKSPEKADTSPVRTLGSADNQENINNVEAEKLRSMETPDDPETLIQDKPEIIIESIKDEHQSSPIHPIKDDFDGKSSAALIIQRAFRQYMEKRKLENFDESSFDSITSSRITAIETSNYPTAGTTPSESLAQEASEEPGEDASEIQPKSEWFVGSTRIVPSQGVVEEPVGLETDPDPAAITSKTELDTSTQVESVENVDRTHGYGSLESKLNTGIISSEIDESLGVTSEKDNAVSSGLAGLTEASEGGLDSVEDPLLLSQSDFGGIVQSLDVASTQELVNSFLESEIEYTSKQGPFPSVSLLQEVVEEPCIKKSASLVNLSEGESKPDVASQKAENTDSSMSETTGLDTLSADTIDKATVKLSKPEEVIEKMSLLRDSKSHERLASADPSIDESVVRPMSSLQEQASMDIEDGDIIVYNRLQRDETRESSAQSDSVVFGEAEAANIQERDLLNEEESGRVHLMRHYTIAGDDPRGLFRSVTIDEALNYVEIGENGMGINSTNSFCLDDETSENIRKKMMAYSLSETDSDYFDPKKGSKEDFDIDTAMADAMGTSTETESTIVSAATKIQAGARGFLTRRRLRRASAGTKSSTLDTKASFGNDAISESLERFIEEEAAKKIQTAYRMHTRKRKGDRKMEGISLESNLAARRQKLQRGDALRNDSTPDDENSVNSSGGQTQKSSKSGRSKTVGETRTKADMELRWLKMRQNSMPVQIDCEVFRVIPKHMRKRIKSAEANKRK